MALANYAELVSELENFLNRTDLTARIPTFIALFESRMNRLLRTPEMEATAYSTATEEQIALPSDYLALREVRVSGKAVPPYAPQDLHETYQNTSSSTPLGYSLIGSSIILYPAPGSSGVEVRITYYQRIPALTSTNTTNWLLTKHPDAYLYGVLCEAKGYQIDPELMLQWKSAWDEVLGEIQVEGNKKRLPATPLAARPAVFE
jgi:hypothetical protein